jgi:hypothetical protein
MQKLKLAHMLTSLEEYSRSFGLKFGEDKSIMVAAGANCVG